MTSSEELMRPCGCKIFPECHICSFKVKSTGITENLTRDFVVETYSDETTKGIALQFNIDNYVLTWTNFVLVVEQKDGSNRLISTEYRREITVLYCCV